MSSQASVAPGLRAAWEHDYCSQRLRPIAFERERHSVLCYDIDPYTSERPKSPGLKDVRVSHGRIHGKEKGRQEDREEKSCQENG